MQAIKHNTIRDITFDCNISHKSESLIRQQSRTSSQWSMDNSNSNINSNNNINISSSNNSSMSSVMSGLSPALSRHPSMHPFSRNASMEQMLPAAAQSSPGVAQTNAKQLSRHNSGSLSLMMSSSSPSGSSSSPIPPSASALAVGSATSVSPAVSGVGRAPPPPQMSVPRGHPPVSPSLLQIQQQQLQQQLHHQHQALQLQQQQLQRDFLTIESELSRLALQQQQQQQLASNSPIGNVRAGVSRSLNRSGNNSNNSSNNNLYSNMNGNGINGNGSLLMEDTVPPLPPSMQPRSAPAPRYTSSPRLLRVDSDLSSLNSKSHSLASSRASSSNSIGSNPGTVNGNGLLVGQSNLGYPYAFSFSNGDMFGNNTNNPNSNNSNNLQSFSPSTSIASSSPPFTFHLSHSQSHAAESTYGDCNMVPHTLSGHNSFHGKDLDTLFTFSASPRQSYHDLHVLRPQGAASASQTSPLSHANAAAFVSGGDVPLSLHQQQMQQQQQQQVQQHQQQQQSSFRMLAEYRRQERIAGDHDADLDIDPNEPLTVDIAGILDSL
jgi:hypothetical protein